jgi:hypothetical protein
MTWRTLALRSAARIFRAIWLQAVMFAALITGSHFASS